MNGENRIKQKKREKKRNIKLAQKKKGERNNKVR